MRICLVHRDIHEPTRGGVCTVYRALAERLPAHGHHVSVITQQTPRPIRTPGVRLVLVTDDVELLPVRQIRVALRDQVLVTGAAALIDMLPRLHGVHVVDQLGLDEQ